MSIERIQAVVQAPAARSRQDDARGPLAQKGDTLRLAFERAAGDDILVADDRGFALRLAGLARHVRDFTPGDVLLLRVLATAPRLELEFLGTAGAGPRARSAEDLAAMRLDQTVVKRISWQLPEAPVLASAWYLRVRDAGRQSASVPALLRLPGPGGESPDTLPAGASALIERWGVPVFAWGSLPAVLRFIPVGEDDRPDAGGERGTLALEIELVLPQLGVVSVRVVCRGGEVRLTLGAEDDEALETLRALAPEIALALGLADMALCGLSVLRMARRAPPRRLTQAQAQQLAAVAAALTPGPFRAVAEVVVVLLATALAADVSPANRRC